MVAKRYTFPIESEEETYSLIEDVEQKNRNPVYSKFPSKPCHTEKKKTTSKFQLTAENNERKSKYDLSNLLKE